MHTRQDGVDGGSIFVRYGRPNDSGGAEAALNDQPPQFTCPNWEDWGVELRVKRLGRAPTSNMPRHGPLSISTLCVFGKLR